MNNVELSRLRKDFERQASRYPDLTLSVYFVASDKPKEESSFKKPNHAVMLWQYMGNVTVDTNIKEFVSFRPTDYGLTGAVVTAFGVIEGPKTKLFRRMAYRAGSLIPDSVRLTMTSAITNNFADPELPGKPVFVANSDPLSIWLNLVLVCIATFQPGRFRKQTLSVDPFAASLASFDHILDCTSQRPVHNLKPNPMPLLQRRFKVALSFPGEKREFISQVAVGLQERLGDVFYDKFFEAELARPDLDILLQKIYHDNSELVVVFICKEYEQKEWCGLEWRAIRDLIKKRQSDDVMPMRFDDTEIPGLFSIDGYIDLQQRTPEEVVEVICRRVNHSPENR